MQRIDILLETSCRVLLVVSCHYCVGGKSSLDANTSIDSLHVSGFVSMSNAESGQQVGEDGEYQVPTQETLTR
eukprot:6466808-Amphidinium_carterae.2